MSMLSLLVVDCQYDFIDGSLACEGAGDAVAAAIAFLNARPDIPILYSPLVREPKAAAQGLGEHGFTQTGHVFDEQMAPGEQAAQGQLDLLVLPQDDAVDLCQHPTEQGTGICLRRGA